MILENDKFTVKFDKATDTVFLTGTLRLQGRDEYAEVSALLVRAADASKERLSLDMRDLEFLNSSGISTLSLFIIEMRKRSKPIRILGSATVSWQEKSLHNFQRLYSGAEVVIAPK